MKQCTKCATIKPLSEFSPRKNHPTGRTSWCKSCKNTDANAKYATLTRQQVFNRREAARVSHEARIEAAKAYVRTYLNAHPCVDCGETDWVVLEFDHIEDKHEGIGYMMCRGLRLEKIIAEIQKCQVRCANCHRRKTFKRAGSWRVT